MLQKHPKNTSDTEYNAYETLVLIYSKELDIHVLAISIIKSDVEEKNSPPYLEDAVTNSKEGMTNLENTNAMVGP